MWTGELPRRLRYYRRYRISDLLDCILSAELPPSHILFRRLPIVDTIQFIHKYNIEPGVLV